MKRFILLFALLPLLSYGAKAPDFTVTDYNNKMHRLYADYLNKEKVMVIKLFFVDCPPCNSLAPNFQQSYVKWGAGSGRVQFMELSTQIWDQNANVRTYSQKHGLTVPGVGNDGGSIAAVAPYKAGTFGPYYGTPTFLVIAPNGEVTYNIPYTKTNQVEFDSAIARALRIPSSGGGGGPDPNICKDSFDLRFTSKIQPDQVYLRNLVDPQAPEYLLKNQKYRCEFSLPESRDFYYFVPNATVTDDIVNGITTADIILIQRHVLAQSSLNNLQLAVADVNNSGTVSTADISELRKLILGNTDRFRFLTDKYTWTINPFAKTNTVVKSVKLNDILNKTKSNEFGIGRYGDVSDVSGFKDDDSDLTSRTHQEMDWILNGTAKEGHYEYKFIIPAHPDPLLGFQFSFLIDVNQIYDIKTNANLNGFDDQQFSLNEQKSELKIIWYDQELSPVHATSDLVLLEFKSKKKLNITSNPNFYNECVRLEESITANPFRIAFKENIEQAQKTDLVRISFGADLNEFHIQSQQAQIVSLNCYDASGSLVPTRSVHGLRSRQTSFHLPEQTGLYIVNIGLDDGSFLVKKVLNLGR